ncbi:blastula protease 10-like [Artemia franciscana]|uniref:blastula protease 10-like n=1 Tax=Artemia franciscana TaxID=6661 RepID=UPI0032DAF441
MWLIALFLVQVSTMRHTESFTSLSVDSVSIIPSEGKVDLKETKKSHKLKKNEDFEVKNLSNYGDSRFLHRFLETINGTKSSNLLYKNVPAQLYRVIGDILYTKETWEMLRNFDLRDRVARISKYFHWPKQKNGLVIVPYQIDPRSFSHVDTSFISRGFKQWEEDTCIRTVPWVPGARLPFLGEARLFITNQPGSCHSFIGRLHHAWLQELSLGNGCWTDILAAHELGHALGLSHEHQRRDRDQYLIVIKRNYPRQNEKDFKKDALFDYSVPYNYLSNMHYQWYAFSLDIKNNLPTMLPRDPSLQYLLSDLHSVSHYDKLVINRAYGCIESWEKKCQTKNNCVNHGYLGPNCFCICPFGTSGGKCEYLNSDSLPAYPPPSCGGNIETPGSYASARNSGNLICIWWIKPPKCQVAVITIKVFYLKHISQQCRFEFFGIRSASLYELDEPMKCGNMVKLGSKFVGKPDIVIEFQSKMPRAQQGYIAFDVSFKHDPSCLPKSFASGYCPFVNSADGSIIVRSYSLFECYNWFKFPRAAYIRAATRYFDVTSSDPYCNNSFLLIRDLFGVQQKECNVEYFNHIFRGQEVHINYKNEFIRNATGFVIILYPIYY